LGRDLGDTDHGVQLVRHEFPAHAGAGLGIQLSDRSWRRRSGQYAAVLATAKIRLVVNLKYTGPHHEQPTP